MKDLARRLNFFAISFIGIMGLTLLSEVFQEDDLPDKIDDALLFILALVGIWWYKKKGYKDEKTHGAIIFVGLGLLIKFIGIVIERGDKEALGDDIGVGISLLLAFIFLLWQTVRNQKNSSTI